MLVPRFSSLSFAVLAVLFCEQGAAQEVSATPDVPWVVVCADDAAAEGEAEADPAPAESDASRCVLRQRLVQAKGGAQVLFAGLRPNADGSAAMRLVVPLGIDVAAGVTSLVDGEPFATVPVQTCLPAGCTALMPLSAEDVERLKDGARMGVAVRAPGGQGIAWPVSLAGFTAAFDEALMRGFQE